jgi:hypothetical protein
VGGVENLRSFDEKTGVEHVGSDRGGQRERREGGGEQTKLE